MPFPSKLKLLSICSRYKGVISRDLHLLSIEKENDKIPLAFKSRCNCWHSGDTHSLHLIKNISYGLNRLSWTEWPAKGVLEEDIQDQAKNWTGLTFIVKVNPSLCKHNYFLKTLLLLTLQALFHPGQLQF